MFVANVRNGRDLVHDCQAPHELRKNAIVEQCPSTIRSAMDLQYTLARSISLRTGGRVRLPQVQIFGSRVVVTGWATSYHAIQLALAGLLETFRAMGLDRPDKVELGIEVIPEESVSSRETEPTQAP